MRKPLLVDLFCCAGGASTGYAQAGFDVIGVDIAPQPRYPFQFWQRDAIEFAERFHIFGGRKVVYHASPPCQHYSDLAKRNGNAHEWPDLIPRVREVLRATGRPYVIENVEGAPLEDPMMLCGTMFPGLRVLRHRLFESNVPLVAPTHRKHELVYTRDKRKAHYGKLDEWTSPVMVNGGGNCSIAAAQDAMGIDWMTKAEINEAIPPVYTEFIGQQILAALEDSHVKGYSQLLPPSVAEIEAVAKAWYNHRYIHFNRDDNEGNNDRHRKVEFRRAARAAIMALDEYRFQ